MGQQVGSHYDPMLGKIIAGVPSVVESVMAEPGEKEFPDQVLARLRKA